MIEADVVKLDYNPTAQEFAFKIIRKWEKSAGNAYWLEVQSQQSIFLLLLLYQYAGRGRRNITKPSIE